mgnify:CR=1 FL=1|jgi:hypothetical protein
MDEGTEAREARERESTKRERQAQSSFGRHACCFPLFEFWLDDTDRVIEIKNLAHTNQKISEF